MLLEKKKVPNIRADLHDYATFLSVITNVL